MLISRPEYLNKLIAFKDKQIIKVITGVRHCGKFTVLNTYQDYLIQTGVALEQIITIDFDDYDFEPLKKGKALYQYIEQRLAKGRMTYIFLDEIQQVDDFQKAVDNLYLKKNIDIYITGSNAYMLSSEIATLLSGRYVQISMLPLSFREYVDSTGNGNELSRKYTEYLENSSFPYTLELAGQPKEIHDYLDALINTIVVKDIIQRNSFSDTLMLKSVLRFLFDNIGNPLSSKKIADTMTSEGRKISVATVEKYINAFTDSYILYPAKRYNIQGKQYLKTLGKYYAVDIGLRYMLLGSRSTDVGHILENVIYLELIRRGYEVYVGKINNLEVDFVAVSTQKTIYYQVAATVRDQQTLARELAPLQKIQDHYQKVILTLDDDPDADYNGIQRTNALNWLIRTSD